MKLGYMTNGFGPLVGDGGGVTSVKDIRYLTMCDDSEVFGKIAEVGFRYVEMLEGNLTKYAGNPEVLKEALEKNQVSIMSICSGANFIYRDALKDEVAHMDAVSKMAADFGVSYITLCGGAIRAAGIQDGDYTLLAEGVAEVKKVIESYGLKASYHPHLGAMVEKPEQIERLFELSDIDMCPDVAHIQAGGGDPLEVVKKYYDRISFMHLKDLDENGFAPLGTGSVKLDEIITYLRDRGYEGDWLVEVDGYGGDPVEACRTSYEYLKGKLI